MLLLTSSWKCLFIFFLIVFLSNARKSYSFFMEILFPHDKFFHGKIPHETPLKKKKSPWKRLYTFQ